MKYNVYAVLDAKGGFFGMPFYELEDSIAIRAFSDAVNDGSNPNNLWHKHPEDFTLYKIGVYDNQKAEFYGQIPEALLTASALASLNGRPKGNLINMEEVEKKEAPK